MVYLKKENGGKHTAHNLAVKAARAAFTVILDSDDELVQGALGILDDEVQSLDRNENNDIVAILGRSIDNGREELILMGSSFVWKVIISTCGPRAKCSAKGFHAIVLPCSACFRFPPTPTAALSYPRV